MQKRIWLYRPANIYELQSDDDKTQSLNYYCLKSTTSPKIISTTEHVGVGETSKVAYTDELPTVQLGVSRQKSKTHSANGANKRRKSILILLQKTRF
jgi:hypothetical protein